jgi:hypothetical protein
LSSKTPTAVVVGEEKILTVDENLCECECAKSDRLLTDVVDLADSLRDTIISLKQVVKISNG